MAETGDSKGMRENLRVGESLSRFNFGGSLTPENSAEGQAWKRSCMGP